MDTAQYFDDSIRFLKWLCLQADWKHVIETFLATLVAAVGGAWFVYRKQKKDSENLKRKEEISKIYEADVYLTEVACLIFTFKHLVEEISEKPIGQELECDNYKEYMIRPFSVNLPFAVFEPSKLAFLVCNKESRNFLTDLIGKVNTINLVFRFKEDLDVTLTRLQNKYSEKEDLNFSLNNVEKRMMCGRYNSMVNGLVMAEESVREARDCFERLIGNRYKEIEIGF